jgi:hypothetical protein
MKIQPLIAGRLSAEATLRRLRLIPVIRAGRGGVLFLGVIALFMLSVLSLTPSTPRTSGNWGRSTPARS